MAEHIDKRTENQFGMTKREQWQETWGSPSYGYSKTGMTPDDIHEEKARRAAEHEASRED